MVAFNSTNNSTNINRNLIQPYLKWYDPTWLAPEIINILLIFCTLWVIVSLLHHGIKAKKWTKSHRRNSEKLSGCAVYTTVVGCAILTLFRCLSSQAVMNLGFGEGKDKVCNEVADASIVLYAFSVLGVYVFLWLRQYIFYLNNMLKTHFTKVLKFISAGSLVLLLISGIGVTALNTEPNDYLATTSGCIYKPMHSSTANITWLVCALNYVLSQLILLGLFVYPLRKNIPFCKCFRPSKEPDIQRKKSSACVDTIPFPVPDSERKSSATNSNTTLNQTNPVVKRKTSAVERIMKRTIIFAVVSMTSDLLLIVISGYVIPSHFSRRISTVIYDANAVVNLLFVIGSFLNWKHLLGSPFISDSRVPTVIITSNNYTA